MIAYLYQQNLYAGSNRNHAQVKKKEAVKYVTNNYTK